MRVASEQAARPGDLLSDDPTHASGCKRTLTDGDASSITSGSTSEACELP
jgi:hypothetical protein